MQSEMKGLSRSAQAAYKKAIVKSISDGTFTLQPYRQVVRRRLVNGAWNKFGVGAAGALVGTMLIGAQAAIAPTEAILAAILLTGVAGRLLYRQAKNALDDMREDLGEFLTDDELEEIEAIVKYMKPSTDPAKSDYAEMIRICNDQIEYDSPEGVLAALKPAVGSPTQLGISPSGPTIDTTAVAVTPPQRDKEDDGRSGSDAPVRTLKAEDVLEFIYNELTLLWGQAGCGKTTAVMAMGNYAASKGFRVMVGDPHYKKGSWANFKVYKTHDECDDLLKNVRKECANRYELRREEGRDEDDFEPWLIILEEFTNWATECEDPAGFVKSAIQDFRKANIHVLMVSHARTLTGLGNPKGFAESFHNGSVQLNLLAHSVDTARGRKSCPTGQARLRFQGGEEELVNVPDLRSLDFGDIPDQSGFEFAEHQIKKTGYGSSQTLRRVGFNTALEEPSEEHKSSEKENRLLPGCDKTLEEAVHRLIEWYCRDVYGKTVSDKWTTQAYSKSRRDAYKLVMLEIFRAAEKKYPDGVALKYNNIQRNWTFFYQK